MGVNTEKFTEQFERQSLRAAYGIKTKHIILFVGRLTEVKGISVLLKAMSRLQHRIDATLLIVGTGVLQDALRLEARELHVEENVRFLGAIGHDQLPQLYHLADVVVIPSIVTAQQTEGTPVVLLEAMVAGRPVVGSHVGGIGDVIRDGYNGRLVPPGNVDRLAEAVLSALKPEQWQTWSENAGKTGQAYDWKNIAAQYKESIDTLVGT